MVNDQFGIKQIYPTKANGEEWFVDTTPSSDGQIILDGSRGNITLTNSGDYEISRTSDVRIGIATTNGYSQSTITLDHDVLAERKYMATDKDWKNVEVTIYFKYKDSDTNQRLSIYTRGGKHSKSRACEGFSYKGAIHLNTGRTRFYKEQWHIQQLSTSEKNTLNIGSLRNKWFGLKFIIYNINSDTNVKGELWIDRGQTNIWELADSFVDQGGWGQNAGKCQKGGGDDDLPQRSDYIGIHGGPLIYYKWEGDAEFKHMSVREIDTGLLGDGDPDPGSDPGTDPPPPPGSTDPQPKDPPITGEVFATLIGLYHINFDDSDGCSGLLVDVPPLEEIARIPMTSSIPFSNDRDAVGLVTHDRSVDQGGNPIDKSVLIGKKVRRVDLYLKNPGGATGIATLNVRRASNNQVVVPLGTIDVSTLTTTFKLIAFENLNNTHRMTKDDKIVLDYSGGSALTNLDIGINTQDFFDGDRTTLVDRQPNPSAFYVESVTFDIAGIIYV